MLVNFNYKNCESSDVKLLEFKRKDKPAIWLRASVKMSTPDRAFYLLYHFSSQIWAIFFTPYNKLYLNSVNFQRKGKTGLGTTHCHIPDTVMFENVGANIYLLYLVTE